MNYSYNNGPKLDPFIIQRLEEFQEQDCYDDSDLVELPTNESTKRNRYASAAENLAQVFMSEFTLKVVGKTLFRYDPDVACYRPIVDPVGFLYQSLDEKNRHRFRIKDLDEVAKRLLFSKSLATPEDDFNSDPNLVNLSNGIWNAHTLSMESHSSQRLFTYAINARYIQRPYKYSHPAFDNFCRTSLDDDPLKKQLLLEIIGVLLSDCSAKASMFLLGASNSGKSVILNFISNLIGTELISSVPLHKLGDRFNIAELWGKKINIVGEIKGRKLPDITTYKTITGSDRVQAERKGRDPFTFTPRAKLLFAGNVLPDTTESDATDAFANRLIPLLFQKSIAPEDRDPDLPQKLWNERNAIVTDALLAFSKWIHNNRQWTLPDESVRFINKYRKNVKSDLLFLSECCQQGDENRVHNAILLSTYEKWCRENGFSAVPRESFFTTVDSLPNIERVRFRDEDGRYRHGRKGIGFIK